MCPSQCRSLWTLSHHLRIEHQATIQNKTATIPANIHQQLAPFGFGYDPQHSILVCLGTAKRPAEGIARRDIDRHLEKCTLHSVTPPLLNTIAIADADDPLPLDIGPPLPAIAVEPGFRCEECKLAFTAPQSQPRKKFNEHVRKDHRGENVKATECQIQKWFGGDSNHRNSNDPAQLKWRYVIVKPGAQDSPETPSVLLDQLELFDKIVPPRSTQSESVDVIDRRELGAVIHRLNLLRFADAEAMRAHYALCHVTQGTTLDNGPDLVSLAREYIQEVQQEVTALPDQVLRSLVTLS